jgi:phage protein D
VTKPFSRPFVQMKFSSGAAERQPTFAEIIEHEFRHELAYITVDSMSVDMKRYQTGVPVTIRFGTGPVLQRTFVGYVSHTEPGLPAANKEQKRIVCVGASFSLMEGGYDGFKDITASAMARRIATKFRLDATHVQDHARVFPTITQSGRSYWKLLVDLAERCGYTLYCRNTNLYFHDRLAALSKQRSIPIYGGPSGGKIYKFKAQIGRTTPTGGKLAHRAAFGVDPYQGKPILAQVNTQSTKPVLGNTPLKALFLQGETARSVQSLSEGRMDLEASAAHNVLSVTAQAELEGNVRVRPGDAVFFKNLGPTNSGRWYVISARHVISSSDYRVEVELGRDAVTSSVGSPPSVGAFPALRSSRAVNGVWIAA